MNCTREKRRPMTCANDRAMSVLARPGIVVDEHVAVGEQPEQDEPQRVALADDGALDLVEDGVRRVAASRRW